jgi:hypothetical protein
MRLLVGVMLAIGVALTVARPRAAVQRTCDALNADLERFRSRTA